MLLDQRKIDVLTSIAGARAGRSRELLRRLMYSGPAASPPGIVNLDTPEKRAMYANYLRRNANREQTGAVPGTVHTDLAQHPDMQSVMQP